MKQLFLLLIISASSFTAYGQIPQLDSLRTGVQSQQDYSWLEDEYGRVKMLKALPAYYTDTLDVVRQRAAQLALRAGQKSGSLEMRQTAVEQLAAACQDESPRVVGVAVNGLKTFRGQDFSKQAKNELVKALQSDPKFYVSDILRLVGFTEPENGMEVLSNYLYDHPKARAKVKLSVRLALARMGDQQALERILRLARRIPVGDNLIYEVLPEVLYTRQPQAIAFAVEVLNAKEKACYPSNPDATSRIVCGYRVMEMLAPVVEGFPLRVGPSGDLDTDDYEKALQTSRQWFAKQKGKYLIRRDQM